MTVADLIDELKRQPGYLPVKVVLTEIYGCYDDTGKFRDDKAMVLSPEDAIEADVVRHEGQFVLIQSK
jgi:hypothetical protein